MPRIFISYARKYESFARKLATSLSMVGADVWLDVEDIPAGMNWSNAIQEGLDAADLMIVVLTPESTNSKNVENEWQYYVDENKSVIPVLLVPTKVHFQLRRLQYIDFHTQNYEVAFRQLHSELRRKGVQLNPLTASDMSVQIPAQAPLPVLEETPKRRIQTSKIFILGMFALVALSAILALYSQNQLGATPTPTTQAAVVATNTADAPPTETLEVATPTSVVTPTPEPTIDIVGVVGTLDAQGTASVRATNIAGTATQAQIFLNETVSFVAGETATATLWTATPTSTLTLTPNVTASIEAFLTERANNGTATAIVNQTATATLWTATPTSTVTSTITPTPRLGIDVPVTTNNQWQPVVQFFEGVDLVLVPMGCFDMGSEDGDGDEQPVHHQCFDQPYWIDRNEVSNGQFEAFNGVANNQSFWTGENYPREMVTWSEASNFCENRAGYLPTETQWEYAARGPDNLIYPWGNEFIADNVVYSTNSGGRTAEIGSKYNVTSWTGAWDMSGNVWEWVSTIYDQNYFPYPYDKDDGRENSEDRTSVRRVLRGGAWNAIERYLKTFTRTPSFTNSFIFYGVVGFRCARDFQEGDLEGAQLIGG